MPLKFTTEPLSHAEQSLYLYLESAGKNAFTISELRESNLGFGTDYLYVLLGRLEKKGWITSVGKGVYLRLPASSAIDGKVYLEDPFEVALKLFPRHAYLAFLSALNIHGLSEYEPFTIFVATKSKSETLELLDQYEVKAVKFGKRFIGYEKKDGYTVSTIAKTFFDCFYHPQYAGGYSEILKSLYSCENPGWQEFRSYLERFGSSSLCQKIGYLLSVLANAEYAVPPDLIEYLRSRVKTKTRLDTQIRKGGKFVKQWLVIDNISERRLLEWWYSG
jgi:predicted transcriptional regulator of viral defense system